MLYLILYLILYLNTIGTIHTENIIKNFNGALVVFNILIQGLKHQYSILGSQQSSVFSLNFWVAVLCDELEQTGFSKQFIHNMQTNLTAMTPNT